MKYLKYFLIILCFFSCEKERELIGGNNAPFYDEVPTILLENYVNRLYIDLIGREPLDDEMERDVLYLRDNDVSFGSRDSLILKLQSDTLFVEGDSSYKKAYFHRTYEMLKVRLLEGVSNGVIQQEMGNAYQRYLSDSLLGNMLEANKNLLQFNMLSMIISSEHEYMHGEININEVHRRMIYNPIYDQINMNTFNFVNASFDNLLYRYPTQYEFDEVYKMIEDNTAQIVFGQSANDKEGFTHIISNTREFYEGVILWSYLTLLARNPSTQETDFLMQSFYFDYDLQYVQREIMKTNEYAHF